MHGAGNGDDAPGVSPMAERLVGLDVPLGSKLASGRDADILDLGEGRVLRRRRDGRNVEHEAAVMRYAHSRGYPVPALYAARGPDQIMARVTGPTMLADLVRRPWMVWRHARLLVRLHHRLHAIPGPGWLPPFPPDRLHPSGALLHLDLHPENVILSPRGPIVIDWANAKRGPGAADLALTWVIMATSEPDQTGPARLAIDVIRRLFVAVMLRHMNRAAVLEQLPAVARFRLADKNVRPSERQAIRALARHASVTSDLT